MSIKRDWKCCAAVVLLLLMTAIAGGFLGVPAVADQAGGDGAASPAITLHVPDSAVPGGAVTVTGSVYDSGPAAGVSLGLTVRDANGAIYYTDQAASGAGGAFSFCFNLPSGAPLDSVWQVSVAGGGAAADKTFTVAGADGVVAVTPSGVRAGSQVTFTGKAHEGNVPIGITVRDANGAVVYVDQTTTAADGSYSFTMMVAADAAIGAWTVDVAGGETTGHEVFTVAEAPVLSRVTLSGGIPYLTAGGVAYDLDNLIRAGYDQNGNPYDISGLPVAWQIVSGNSFAGLDGSNLTPVSAGAGTVTAAVYGMASNPAGFAVNPSYGGSSNLFVQVTDMHLCSAADAVKYLQANPGYDPEAYASRFVAEMESLQPSFVVNTGDLVALADSKKLATGLAWYQVYGRDVAQPLRDAGIPLYDVSGNHDLGGTNYYTGPDDPRIPADLRAYYGNDLFTLSTGSQRCYSFDRGDYHYIVLDPDETGNSSNGVNAVLLPQEQLAWLQADLQANSDKNVILFFHQPSSDWLNWTDVSNILKDYRIRMIFDGHWHLNAGLDNGFTEQSTSALCGSWWRYPAGKDGSPFGYRLVYPAPGGVRSFYKELGNSHQIDLIAPVDIAIGGQVQLYAQAYDDSQNISAMQYRIDAGDWQPMSLEKVAVWYEGRATLSITPDGNYHQVEVSYLSNGDRVNGSTKRFRFDADPVVDLKEIGDHFEDYRGRYATVEGAVTAAFAGGAMPVIQDESGAMPAWTGDCASCPSLNMGSGIRLRGQVATDGQVYPTEQLQVYAPDDVAGAVITPITDPRIVAIPDVAASCYQLVRVQGVTVAEIADSSDFYVEDQNQNRLAIYTGEQSPAFDATASLHAGETLDVSGIAWLYNGSPEICTRIPEDLVPQASGLTAPVKIAVLSDPHYYAPELGTTGSAFQRYLDSDRKMLAESKAILASAVTAIKNSDAQIVLVCGDLTKDGELVNHQQFAACLKQLKEAGKKVYVIDGNHDINNPDAFSYSGDTRTSVAGVAPDQFREIYQDYGYGEAVAVDPGSLSYAVDPLPGLRIIAMDSALYGNNIASGAPETGGAFSDSRLAWIDAEIDDGVAGGKTVIGMMHHGVTNHFSLQSLFFPDYVIQSADQVAADLAGRGMRVVFTGHFHANDITKAPGQTLFDVETGSLVTYPVPYRFVELTTGNQLKITTDRVANIDYDTGGQAFQDYARNYLAQGISGMVPSMLAGIIKQQQPGLTDEQAMAAAASAANQVVVPPSLTVRDLLTGAMVAHYQGDERPDAQTLAVAQGMYASGDPLTMMLGGAILSLYTDLFPPDSDIALDLSTGSAIDALVTDAITYQLAPGGSHQTVVTLISGDGSTHDVTEQATYTSSNPAVATVSASGLVTALASGASVITAVYGSSQECVNLTVAAAVPVIALNIPDAAVQGTTVHVAGGISNNGPVAGAVLGITVRDANGAINYIDQTTSAADGAFSFYFGLPSSAALGTWRVFVSGGGALATKAFTVQAANLPVTVASAVEIQGIKVFSGTSLANVPLPAKAAVSLSDGATAAASVTWDGGTPAYDGNAAGTYAFSGALGALPANVTNPDNIRASVQVTVQQAQTVTVTSGAAIAVATDQPQSIAVPQGVTPPPIVATVTTNPASGQNEATLPLFNASIQQTVQGKTQTVLVQIPDQTAVSGSASWNGEIRLPQVVSSSGVTGLGSATVNLVLQLGDPDQQLNFNKAVRILLPGMSGKSVGYTEGGGDVIPITYNLSADTQQAADAAFFGDQPAAGAGYIDAGHDLAVWTSHFCNLVAYTARSSGGGGGGGGSANTPSIETEGATSITDTSAVLGGSITASGGASVTDYGFIWGAGQDNLDQKQQVGTDDHSGAFQAVLGGLTPETTYFFKAYAANSNGTALGSLKQFATTARAVIRQAQPPAQPGPEKTFTDLPWSYWASDAIIGLAGRGCVSGYADGTFRPEEQITRAEFTTIIARSLGLSGAGSPAPGFEDSDSIPGWAGGYIAAGVQAGLVCGYEDGTFRAGDSITRTEIAVIIAKALHAGQSGAAAPDFADAEQIPSWAAGYVSYDVVRGILSGYPDHTFQPARWATRAEACAMIVKMLHNR